MHVLQLINTMKHMDKGCNEASSLCNKAAENWPIPCQLAEIQCIFRKLMHEARCCCMVVTPQTSGS